MKGLPHLFLVLLSILLPACTKATEAKAQSQARQDIEAGKPEYRVYGERSNQETVLADILKTQYGVTLHQVAGCLVTEEICKNTEAYNATVAEHLEKIYHKDVFAAAETEFMSRLKKWWEDPNKAPTLEKP